MLVIWNYGVVPFFLYSKNKVWSVQTSIGIMVWFY